MEKDVLFGMLIFSCYTSSSTAKALPTEVHKFLEMNAIGPSQKETATSLTKPIYGSPNQSMDTDDDDSYSAGGFSRRKSVRPGTNIIETTASSDHQKHTGQDFVHSDDFELQEYSTKSNQKIPSGKNKDQLTGDPSLLANITIKSGAEKRPLQSNAVPQGLRDITESGEYIKRPLKSDATKQSATDIQKEKDQCPENEVEVTQSNSYVTDEAGSQQSHDTMSNTKNSRRLYCGMQAHQYSHRRKLLHRILNGHEAQPHSKPWQVLLHITESGEKRGLCGGIIIPVEDNQQESDVVLTAAHCIKEGDGGFDTIIVRAGLHDITSTETRGVQCRKSQIALPHKEYSDTSKLGLYDNDIALLFMEKPFQFTDTVKPICLPEKWEEEIPVGKICTVTGWGTNKNGGRPQSKLQELLLTLLPPKKCAKNFPDVFVDEHMLCATGRNSGQTGETCQGDSGGPVQCLRKDGRWTLLGLVSLGKKCGDVNVPGVYSRVSAYLDWMREQIIKYTRVRHSVIGYKKWTCENADGNCDMRIKGNIGYCITNANFARFDCCRSCAIALNATSLDRDDPTILSLPCVERSWCESRVSGKRSVCVIDDIKWNCMISCSICDQNNQSLQSSTAAPPSNYTQPHQADTQHNRSDFQIRIPITSNNCEINGKNKGCVEWPCKNDAGDDYCNRMVKNDVVRCNIDGLLARSDCCKWCAHALNASSLDRDDPVISSLACVESSGCKRQISGNWSLCAVDYIQSNCMRSCGICNQNDQSSLNVSSALQSNSNGTDQANAEHHQADTQSSNRLTPKKCESNGKNKGCVKWTCKNTLSDDYCNKLVKQDSRRCSLDTSFARFQCCRSCAIALHATSLDRDDPVILSLPCVESSACEKRISGDWSVCKVDYIQKNCMKSCGIC